VTTRCHLKEKKKRGNDQFLFSKKKRGEKIIDIEQFEAGFRILIF